ncbi:MAG: V-type ATPase subunit [Firmicutes bacterium]|nr:V-type ATPase subunit [Bacillota bacterium]
MSSKNIYANTAAEYEAGNLLSRSRLKQIVSLNYDEAIKRLVAINFFKTNSVNDDVDALIKYPIKKLTDFINEYSLCKYLTEFLLTFLDFQISINIKERFDKRLHLTQKLGKHFVDLVRTDIDLINLLTFYRSKKIGISFKENFDEYIDGGFLNLEEFDAEDYRYSDAVNLLKEYDFENFAILKKNQVFSKLKHNQHNFLRNGPFLRFFFSKLFEIKNIRYILILLKNNINPNLDHLWSFSDE